MGDTAVNIELDEEQVEDEIVDKSQDEDNTEVDNTDADDQGVEIVLETSDEDSQTSNKSTPKGFLKRIGKLNNKVEEANSELEIEREKRKLAEIALQQAREQQEAPAKPKPDDFEDGRDDPKFQEKLEAYNEYLIDKKVAEKVSTISKTETEKSSLNQQAQTLKTKQINHYQKVSDLGIDDYEAAEDVALETLGQNTVNTIISNIDDAHILLYYLGKNPAQAESIAYKIQTNPVQGIVQLGELKSKLKVKPRKPSAPNPDEDVPTDRAFEKRGPKGAKFE